MLYDLGTASGPTGAARVSFKDNWIKATLFARDVRPLIGSPLAPAVQITPLGGNPVFNFARRWALRGCPGAATYDVVEGQIALIDPAEFLSPSCAPGAYLYDAAVQTIDPVYGANVIYLPYDLSYVIEDTDCGGRAGPSPYPVRAEILRDVLLEFANPVGSPVVGLPTEGDAFAVSLAPNPFNPKTTIRTIMPGRGRLTVEVYDVRGRLVRTLHDGLVAAGEQALEWSGDGAGDLASGIYFVRVSTPFGERLIKAALVR